MLFERFHGTDLRTVFMEAEKALGEDVMIVQSHVAKAGNRTKVEVVAARGEDLETLKRRLAPPAPSLPTARGGRGRSGPFILALVGPTGAGKTTTAAKLALHPQMFGAKTVGFLTLDTYRVGALEQMQQYAEIANLQLEVVYDAREVVGAMKRLGDCDVVIVDTPGRSPRMQESNTMWQQLLRPIAPDEVHLVIPASARVDLAAGVMRAYAACRPTHLLMSKLDEVPQDSAIGDLAGRIDLPMRWITDGQTVPDDVRVARPRVLAALGLELAATRVAAA